MSLKHSPSVVTDGLVMYYDISNTKKSWKGRPVTNQFAIPTPDSSLNVGFQVNGTGIFKRVLIGSYGGYDITPTDVVYRYDLGATGCHYHGNDVTITAGQVATWSFDYYVDPSVTGYPSTNYLANFEGVLGGAIADPTPSIIGVWKKLTFSGTAGSTGLCRMLIYPGACGDRLATGGFVLFKNPQVEFDAPGSTPSPYVSGTRSITQSIVDPVGDKTITPTNLNSTSYSDNTCITLDGNNQYLYTSGDNYWNAWSPNGTNGNAAMTIELIFNSSDTSGLLISRPWNGGGQYNYTMSDSGFGLHSNASGASLGYSSICTGTNIHMVWWMNSTQYGVYKNGVEYVAATNHGLSGNGGSSGTNAFGTLFGSLYPYGEGWGGNTGFSIAGKYYLARIYNRVLLAAEVKQNFNALRGRYGI